MLSSKDSPTSRPFRSMEEYIHICRALTTCPTGPIKERARSLLENLAEAYDRKSRILGLVQEALSQLRLDMKYLIFDLEATRRERDELQKRLEERGDG